MVDERGRIWRRRVLGFLLLFVFALTVRGLRAWQIPVLNPDVIRFITQARGLTSDPVRAVRKEVYHPLHAAAGLAVRGAVHGIVENDRAAWLLSMQIVGVLAGALVAVQIAMLGRMLGAPFWAAIAAGVVWVLGRRTSAYGADGISDMLFLSLFAGAMLMGLRALRFRGAGIWKYARFVFAGMLAGLAYLTRPEGLAAALILILSLCALTLPRWKHGRRRAKFLPRRRLPVRSAVGGMACVILGVAIFAAPYMATIGGITGKKAFFENSAEEAFEVIVAGFGGDLLKMGQELFETFGFAPALLLFAAIPLTRGPWGRPRTRIVVVLWIVLWVGVMLWLIRRAGYLDGRHTLPMQLVLHGMLALAFGVWGRAIRKRFENPRIVMALCAAVVVLAIIPGVVRLGVAPSADRKFVRDAAAWLATSVKKNTVVCDDERLVGYYSGLPYAFWGGRSEPSEVAKLDWLVLNLEKFRSKERPHVICAVIFRPKKNQPVIPAIREWRMLKEFPSERSGDVLVLYARDGDRVLREK
jgi:hypothetical protein